MPSRRLNVSLGIDLIPFKTCTLNCIYCESGKTTDLRTRRERFIDPDLVMQELRDYLDRAEYPLDYVTFSGSGEPTLSIDIGYMIREIKKISQYPVAVLTNGTLLFDPGVREELMGADLVMPSVDAVRPEIFDRICQPSEKLDLKRILEGLRTFSRQFTGDLWVEVFLVRTINDQPGHLSDLHRYLTTLRLDKVQLNSIDRPPAYRGVRSLSVQELDQIREKWSDLPVEIIKRVDRREDITAFCKNLENSILNTIRRRPMTLGDLQNFTGKTGPEVRQYLDILTGDGRVEKKVIRGKVFYCPRPPGV